MQYIFITGTYRSGTTLADKLLSSHPNGFVASQPFPFLYYDLMKLYNVEAGLSNFPYPIHPAFVSDFNPGVFQEFLDGRDISNSFISKSLSGMRGYSGCGTPEIFDLAENMTGGQFLKVYRELCHLLAKTMHQGAPGFIGAKEIIGEDFMPVLLRAGIKVLLLVRDPRDIILSANFSAGKHAYMGNIRPILYTLQMWRKSVSYAIEYGESPDLLILRYEDLVKHPFEKLDEIADFMDVDHFDREHFRQGIYDQYGKLWKGNSSFTNFQFIDASSSGRYKTELTQGVIDYINSVCSPELKFLGYRDTAAFNQEVISGFREPDYPVHKLFDADYSSSAWSVKKEIMRHKLLVEDSPDPDEVLKYFLFKNAYVKLKSQLEK